MAFGLQIRQSRKKHGYTQKELADIAGVSLMTIRRIESAETDEEIRRFSFGIISTLARILDNRQFVDDALLAYGLPIDDDADWFMSLDPNDENIHAILAAYDNLNYTGQCEAKKRVEELTEIPRYQRQQDNGEQKPD